MKLAHVLFACSILAATPASSLAASGDQFPNRPIRVVIGPGTDTLIRLLAPKLQSAWTHPLVVDQRPGAGGAVAAEIVDHTQFSWTSHTTYPPETERISHRVPRALAL